MFDILGQSFSIMGDFLVNPWFWVALILAVLIAGPIGLVPGIGGNTVIVLTLPFLVMSVEPAIGLLFVAGLLSLNNTLDSVPAVLLGYPGAATQVTFLEGHQLARRGQGARVLGAVYVVSAIGGIIGALTLLLVMPAIRPIILNFSFAEIAAMAMFGIAMVAVLARGSMARGLASALLGILVSTIGVMKLSAIQRFTFGEPYMAEGLPLIPVLIGIFALPEMIDLAMSKRAIAAGTIVDVSNREVWIGAKEGLKRWRTIPRQSVFGVALGAIPGVGSAVVDWLAYGMGIAFSKDKSQFGKGSLDGVLFAESAQNSKEAGQAIPTLAFGVPGGSGWALALVALLAYGIAPGPALLGRHLDVTMGMVLGIGLGNLLVTLCGLLITGWLARLVLLPPTFVAGMVIPLMFLAAFQATFQWADILLMLSVGALGMAMKWFRWPRPPFLLGFILGPTLENNLWTAWQYDGALTFVYRPYAFAILILAVCTGWYLLRVMKQGERMLTEQEAGPAPVAGASDTARTSFRFRWRWEYILILILGVWTVYVVTQASGFVGRTADAARFIPMWGGVAFLGLLGLIVFNSLRPSREQEIMDLGMRAGTDWSAFKALLVMVGWLGGLIVAVGTIGFQWAAVLFPIVFINATLPWKGWGRLWTLVPAAMAAFVVFGVLDNALHVIWPERFILRWFF